MPRRTIYFLLGAYLVLLHLALLIVLLKPGVILRLRSAIHLYRPETDSCYDTRLTFQLRVDSCVPPSSVLFFGDSITEGLCVSAVTEAGINFGIGSDTTLGLLRRIPRYHSLSQARAVVLAVGANDIERRSNEEIVENMRKIAALIPRQIPVVVSAVLPVDENSQRNRRNDRIEELNRLLKDYCSSRQYCLFVDSGAKLKDSSGNLAPRYHIGDGVHLSREGYFVWIDDLKKTLAATDGSTN